MIDFNFNKDCCGCRACVEICPKQCITMETNNKGFYVPKVDLANCVDCHLCEKICPVLNVAKRVNSDQKLYCAYNNEEEIREKGSSGSIFYIVAEYVIEQGGCVCGAAFQDKLQLKHIMVDKLEDLYPLMKSKYLQSNTNGIFKQVRNELKKNRLVLFVGTPCQVQALYNFLGHKFYENLILIDFICHGVPSQELFDRCIQAYERRNNCEIIDFSFREKSKKNFRNYNIVCRKDNQIFNETNVPVNFPFYNGFLKYITFRNSCYDCLFLGRNRISDFTLGDFWGIEHAGIVDDFNKGYSMLYVNSSKGADLLHTLKESMTLKEYELDSKYAENYAYLKPTSKSIINRCLMWDYNRISHDKLERRYFSKWHDNSLLKKIILYSIYKLGL